MKIYELLTEAKTLNSKNIPTVFKGQPLYVVVVDSTSYSSPYYVTTAESMKPLQQDIINRLKKPKKNDFVSLIPLVEKFKAAREQGLKTILIVLKPSTRSMIKTAMIESEDSVEMLTVDSGEVTQISSTKRQLQSDLSKLRKVAKVITLTN